LRLVVRFLLLVAIVVAGFAALRWSPLAAYLSQEQLAATLDRLRGIWWAPLVLLGAYLVLCPVGFPAMPLMFAGGMVFGTLWGSVYNVAGLCLGGASTYLLGRGLGRDFVLHLAGRRMKRVERAISRHGGFWSMVGLRFVPLPFVLVNYCAALAGIRPALFFTSTATGLALTVPVFTYFAATLSRAASGHRSGVFLQLGVALTLLTLVTLLPRLWYLRKRKLRYRELVASRKGR
jgi:uncharacterized membrane protein YdjX (TVP38/TMEM64 family)